MGIEADGGWRMADGQSAASLHYDYPAVRVSEFIPQKEIGNSQATRHSHSYPSYPQSAIRRPLPSFGIEADGGWRMADGQSAASLHYDYPAGRVSEFIPQKEIGNSQATRQGHSCPSYPLSAIRYPLPS